MNHSQVLGENFCFHVKDNINKNDFKKFEFKKMLKSKFKKQNVKNRSMSSNSWSKTRTCNNWYDAFGRYNAYAKEIWKNGADKILETFGNLRSTFGNFSGKIKNSTKHRQSLIKLDSQNTTPNERSRAVLGRTPTKLYSPFDFDTPKKRRIKNKKILTSSCKKNLKFYKRKHQESDTYNQLLKNSLFLSEVIMSNESLQTQIGIYEFDSLANKIVKN